MSRIGHRLKEAESRAPKPFETMVWTRVIVAPNPELGGPPIVCGIHSRTKTIPGGFIKEIWSELHPENHLPEELLVSQRCTYRGGGLSTDEKFDPPVPESQLPAIRREGPSTPSDEVRGGVA